MKNDIKYWFKEYLKDHTTKNNIRIHYIGVPVVTISLLGLLDQISFFNVLNFPIGLGLILLLISFFWYLALDFKLALLFIVPIILFYYASLQLSVQVHLVLQTVGWLIQLYGHYKYEKKSPAFFKSLPQLLIGPIFIYAKFINYDWKK